MDNTKEVQNSSSASNSDFNANNIYTKETVNLLSNGVLKLYSPSLSEVKNQLKELTDKQLVLVEQLHNENLKVSWTQNSAELHEMYDTMKFFQNKLVNIKKDMRSIHERSLKLKKRAIRLQQFKDKELYVKNQQKEMELKREQDLIAKPTDKK